MLNRFVELFYTDLTILRIEDDLKYQERKLQIVKIQFSTKKNFDMIVIMQLIKFLKYLSVQMHSKSESNF